MAKNSVKFEGALSADTRKTINDNLPDVSLCTTQFDAASGTTGTTLTNVVGMVTGILDPGTYRVKIHLQGSAGAAGGIKAAFLFGTASMLTSVEVMAHAYVAAGVAVARANTATDGASLVASTSAALSTVIEGTVVIAKAGTLRLQAAQNASNATSTIIYVGSYMEFVKVA